MSSVAASISPAGPRRRVMLLTAQAFALGLTLAWITIPANTIFLEKFGSGLLPVTYIGAAVAGAASSVFLGRALRRRPVASVAVRLLVASVATLLAAWLILLGGAEWMSFLLLVLLPVALPVGFMFVVGQAGLLLDVRVLKALYPRVIAGFALGFTLGGLAGAPLISLLGGTEQLLAAATVTAAVLLALVLLTIRNFTDELSVLEEHDDRADAVTFTSLLRNRFVVLIMMFQVLSAIESQWLDFLVYDRAAQRYTSSAALAEFVGRFSALAYGADIVFLLLASGLLMRRFGLRFGLRANPGVVLALVAAVLVASIAQGSAAAVVFFLVVATRVSDIALSDGASRTAVSAAYQAVPGPQRAAAQAGVESMAVPVAIGFSGLVLVGLRATVGTDGIVLPALVFVVLAAWVACAVVLYADYGTNLLANLRHRLLEPTELDDGEGFADDVVDRLLASSDPRDVRLGLTALSFDDRPETADRLERLARQGRAGQQEQILGQLAEIDADRAVAVARAGVDDERPFVVVAALHLLAERGGAPDAAAASSLFHSGDDAVRLAAARTLASQGDASDTAPLGPMLAALSRSEAARDRALACDMLRTCPPGSWMDRGHLGTLLLDDDPSVVRAAMAAFRWPDDMALAPIVVDLLHRRETTAAAIEVLARGGVDALQFGEEVLSGSTGTDPRGAALWSRVCRAMGGPHAAAMLERHAFHADRDVGLSMTRALATMGSEHADSDRSTVVADLVRADLDHAQRLLSAMVVLEDVPAAATLCVALADELGLLRRRAMAALALRLGVEAVSRVEFQLQQANTRVHALALEWLEVELSGPERRVLSLLDPALSVADRHASLAGSDAADRASVEAVIRDLAEDRDGVWRRAWVSACALLAAERLDGMDHAEFEVSAHGDSEIVRETLLALSDRRAA